MIELIKINNVNEKIQTAQAPLQYEPFHECPKYFLGNIADGRIKDLAIT